jgi:photosystem II stability/assembly factor-like uncharacterized protein
MSSQELWALGVDFLAMTSDGGSTWQNVFAPRARNPIGEHLYVDGSAVMIAGERFLRTVDHGGHWIEYDTHGARITAAAGRFLAAMSGDDVVYGELGAQGVQWIGRFRPKNGAEPFKIEVDRTRIRIATAPELNPLGGRIRLYESRDGGQGWSHVVFSTVYHTHCFDLGPGGAGIAIDYDGHVLRPLH